MATESLENQGNPYGNIIKTAIGLAPLAVGGYIAFNKIKGNTALNPAIPLGVGGSGNLISVASELGKEIKVNVGKSRAADLSRIDKVSKEIMKADGLKKLFSTVEEQRVLVQSLLDTLSDPTSGVSQDVLLSYREKLLNLATNAPDSDDMRESIKAVVKAIDTQGTDNAKVRLAKNLREYKKLGPSLVPPGQALTPERGYIDLNFSGLKGHVSDSNTYKAIKRRYKALENALGGGGRQRIQLVGKEFDGAFSVYARVSTGSRFTATVPLHVGTSTSGVRGLFLNEGMTTGYAAPRQFLSAQKLHSLGPGLKAGAGTAEVAMEDVFLNEFVSRLKNVNGRTMLENTNAYGAWQRQFLTVMPRGAYSADRSGHLLGTIAQAQNYATVVGWQGLGKEAQYDIMTRLGAAAGYEANAPGYQMIVRGIDDETIGRMGMASGSALHSLMPSQSADRFYFPVESRIEQMIGRTAQFVDDKPMRMGRGGVFSAGAMHAGGLSATNMVGQNIEWANNLTGATNKAVVMVFNKDNPIYKTMEGSGAALYAGRDKVVDFISKPVLDPTATKQMSSKLFQHLTTTYKPGEEFTISREMLKEHGAFLGFSGNGPQHLRLDPRTDSMQAIYNVTETNGKRNINFMIKHQRDMETWKAFSLSHKGMLQQIGGRRFIQHLEDLGLSKARRQSLGIPTRHTVIATPDMLKKGAGLLDLQMSGAYAMVTGDTNYLSSIRKAGMAFGQGLDDSRLARTFGGVTSLLSKQFQAGKVSAEDIGLVLSGAWFMGDKHKRFGLTQDLQKGLIEKHFGNDSGQVLAAIQKGVGLSPTSMVQGMGPGDYGLGRGSIEPRFLQMLQQQLQNMGMTSVQSAKVLADIYGRKLGGANAIKASQGMMKFLESVGGHQGLATGIEQLVKGVPEYTLADLGKITSQDFANFLSEHKNGFTLNLTSGVDSVAKSAIAAAATDVLGQGNVYFPGLEMTEAMRDVFIKNSGEMDTVVHGEWMRNSENFLKSIHGISTQTVGASDAARGAIEGFVKRGRKMAADTIHNIHRGKIRGMQAMIAAPFALESNVGFAKSSQFKFARNIMRKTRGQAVFFDSTAFISQLADYMGTKDGNVGHAARQAEMFFLSPELAMSSGKMGKVKGLAQIGQRHPTASLGNIFVTQVYRDPRELGKSNDYLNTFLETEVGKGWAAKKIRRFKDLEQLSAGKRRAFFTDFVREIDSFAPEGGGIAYLPVAKAKVNLIGANEPSMNVDIGFSAAAIGDFDGDTFMFTPVNSDTGKLLLGRMGKKSMDEWAASNALYKIKSELFTKEAKAGLDRQAGSVVDIDEAIKQGLLKEQAAKAAVGSLDTRLNKLRLSLVDMHLSGQASRDQVSEALSLLKVLQEHTTIKGKKLPVYKPFAESLTAAVDRVFDSGDWGSFERVLNEDIFKGSQLLEGGVTIDSVSSDGFGFFGRGVQKQQVSLAQTVATMKQAVSRSQVTGIANAPSANWMVKGLASQDPVEAERMMTLMTSGQLQATATLMSATEDAGQITKTALARGQSILQNIGHYISGLDNKTTGIIAGGILAATATMAMIGNRGYSSQALTMPGEIAGNDIDKQISSGQLLGPPRKNYPTATPQQIGTTYVQGRSTYSVRGILHGIGDVANATNYLSTISGGNMRGSVSINDNRRPISGSYVDRFFGVY